MSLNGEGFINRTENQITTNFDSGCLAIEMMGVSFLKRIKKQFVQLREKISVKINFKKEKK